jgi:hypothetical protein
LAAAAGAVGITVGILIAGSSAGTNRPQLAPGVRSSVSAVSIGTIALGSTPVAVKVRKSTSESTATGERPSATVTTSTASTTTATVTPSTASTHTETVHPKEQSKTQPVREEEESSALK